MHHHTTTGAGLFSRSIRGHTVLTITGELDIATSTALRDRIAVVLDDAATRVIIDLSAVSFCDASGLAMLVHARRRAGARGQAVVLAGPRPSVRKLLHLTGLHHTFAIYPTVTEALLVRTRAYRSVTV